MRQLILLFFYGLMQWWKGRQSRFPDRGSMYRESHNRREGKVLPAIPSGAMRPASDDGEYPAIADYAVIGDCRTVALVSRQGSIDWLCLPYFSAPAVFAALLDRRQGGRFAVRPATPFSVQRRYRGDTNVLKTTFTTASGMARVTDCMPVLSGSKWARSLQPQREILRIVEGLAGEVTFEIIYQPRPDYARAGHRLVRRGMLGWACQHQDQQLILHTDLPLNAAADGMTVRGQVSLPAGQSTIYR